MGLTYRAHEVNGLVERTRATCRCHRLLPRPRSNRLLLLAQCCRAVRLATDVDASFRPGGRVLFSLRLRGTSGTNGGGREGTVPRPRDESQHARFFYFLNVVRERSAQEFFLLYFFMHSGHTTPTGSCFQRRCPHPPLALGDTSPVVGCGAASAAPHRPQLYCRLCS
jgi:hypothetical protein